MDVKTLHVHPRNYRRHPPAQLQELAASIRANGLYKNIVIDRGGTILAGHGIAQAAAEMGVKNVPVVRLDVGHEDPAALRVLVGDNEIARLAEVNDRVLSELLIQIREEHPDGLSATGYSDADLAELIYVTRQEVGDMQAALKAGKLPSGTRPTEPAAYALVVRFLTRADRRAFADATGLENQAEDKRVWTAKL